jgi:hypothetical protein
VSNLKDQLKETEWYAEKIKTGTQLKQERAYIVTMQRYY